MLFFNCILQLSFYSFGFLFTFCSFKFFDMQILISFNFVIQLELVIYATFHFCYYFGLFYPFIFYSLRVLICWSFVFRLELNIYFVFYFGLYSFSVLFDINSFCFFNTSWSIFFFIYIHASMHLAMFQT